MGHFCDGRASLVVGTHTHAPTADLRILPGGTAFISDVGMTGDYDSVIGMGKEEPLQRFLRRIPSARFEPALGPGDAVRGRGRDRSGDRAGGARRRRCGSAARWSRRGRRSGLEVPLPDLYFRAAPLYEVVLASDPAAAIRNSAIRRTDCFALLAMTLPRSNSRRER